MFSAYLECSKYQCFESVQSVLNGPSVYSVQSGNLGEPFERFRSPPPNHIPIRQPPKNLHKLLALVFSPPHTMSLTRAIICGRTVNSVVPPPPHPPR